jgi:plastocyanin
MTRSGAISRRLRIATLVAVIVTLWVPLGAGPARAGGCGSPPTQGTAIEIVDACFQPSLLTISRGATVTFVNRDPFAHNVGGHLWGHFDDLNEGQRFEATFHHDGIYPFACTLHPGMTGAIVVGDGVGAGNGHTVSVTIASKLTGAGSPAPVVAAAAPLPGDEETAPIGWLLGGLVVGIGLGALAWPAAGRFRRRTGP